MVQLMSRLTITLPDSLHRALKETAARRGQTQAEVIAESLVFYGIKSEEDAIELVERARAAGGLDEREALEIAIEETRAVRGR